MHTVDTKSCVTWYVHAAGEDCLLGQGGGGQEGVHLQGYFVHVGVFLHIFLHTNFTMNFYIKLYKIINWFSL